MSKLEYLKTFVTFNDDASLLSVSPDWSDGIDLNLEFRHQVIDSLTLETSVAPAMMKALLKAEVEYCEKSWCGTPQLRKLASVFHELTDYQYVDLYNACASKSYDIENCL
ncbi:hypothetical protein CW735_15645 [Alteromonas sp. MB-3u-76]|uniref:hypothetical protein n=1 Tax=Alteromonas sp. MB-3u-76 TaxID=2058133 RepID=UPI000C307281|nr:hypothetical protein [Alteromonas sp. MB-3u-76]AUC89444.1 hypothetical protein CW735_15645 [Alteromonas sp. MB-3u-76]